jgi:hypothetical protein
VLRATFTVTKVCYSTNNGAITTSPTGITPLSYIWRKNGVIIATTPHLSNLTDGTYNLELKDSYGCTKNYSVVVPLVSGSNPLALSFTITGSNPQLYKATVSGGSGANTYTYQWSALDKPAETAEREREKSLSCPLPQNYINTEYMPTSYENINCKLKNEKLILNK